MADDLNILAPEGDRRRVAVGDVPDQLRRRYLTEARGGPGLGFFSDARTDAASFRDQGRRLTTDRNDPHVVRDLIAVAQHRDWNTVAVRGHSEFRREVWMQARIAGLEVKGYSPTERDRQQLARRRDHDPTERLDTGAEARLKVVEAVVRSRVVEPGEQARILSAARTRLAQWLERGALFERPHGRDRERR